MSSNYIGDGFHSCMDTSLLTGFAAPPTIRKATKIRLIEASKPKIGNQIDQWLAGTDAAIDIAAGLEKLLPILIAKGATVDIGASELTGAGLLQADDVVGLLCSRYGLETDGTPEGGLAALAGYAAGRTATGQDGASRGRSGVTVGEYLRTGQDATPAPRRPIAQSPRTGSSQIDLYLAGG